MKHRCNRNATTLAAVVLVLALIQVGSIRAQSWWEESPVYYGVEINDVLCGYAEIQLVDTTYDGQSCIRLNEHLQLMLSALGSQFDTKMDMEYFIDPRSGNFLRHSNRVEQGETRLGVLYTVRDGALYMVPDGEEESRIAIDPDVVLPNPYYSPHLLRLFTDPSVKKQQVRMLQEREGEVHPYTVTRLADETVELAGRKWNTMVFDETDEKTSLSVRQWIDRESGVFVQALVLGRKVFRTDASVVKKIEVADMNPSLVVKTNRSIADIQGIDAMKVRAKLAPVGLRLSPAALNVAGQSFTGTVEENAIDGIFEVRHRRYDGSGAPPFPTDYSGSEELSRYLVAEKFCEADDEVLVAKAREIAAGAKDSWEAAKRLSEWVAKNISYAIPGGGSARKTYDTRAGECGAHSLLLAAFCRAVGIPARVVWGCMYVPNQGGAFGQHGWNEIYMGDAGWIPVDATAMEIDYVDSGHLRIGELEGTTIALNAQEFEILDYTLAAGPAGNTDRLAPYLGVYSGDNVGGKEFTVLEKSGKLAVDIPGQMVLLFNDPGDDGRWPCQLSPKLHVDFEMADGQATALRIHEEQRMPRAEAAPEIPADTPDEYRPLIASYKLQGTQYTFDIVLHEGALALKEPRGNILGLVFDETSASWQTEDGTRRVSFEKNDDGNVTAMNATFITRIPKN